MPKYRKNRHSITQPSDPSIRLIPLTHGQNAIVDAKDFEFLSQFNWTAVWSDSTKSYYAKRTFSMHELILGQMADHQNHDTLDNRRRNLRHSTVATNMWNRPIRADNTSGFIGVNFHKGKWNARISVNGKRKHLGDFKTPEEATRARDKAVKELHGEFAILNFPE